jgi:HEAT repeat protein
VNLTLNPNYVYFTAWEAARTQDPRALPVLKATLRERGLSVFIPQHAMTVAWPLTQEFLWTAYGPAGLPVLAQVLAESKDESALATAAILLGQAQYAEALPALRKLARDGTGEARGQALRALGLLGHPDDFPVLMAALKSSDAAVALHAAWALIEYDDLRGAAALVPLVDSKDEDLRREAVMGLAMLPTPEGVAALRRQAESAADEKERAYCARAVKGLVAASGVEADAWAAQSPEEQAKSLGVVLAASGAKYRLKPDDRLLSHEELLKACAEWQERGRLTGGNYVWVEDRHVLAAATAADIPLLLSVKARVCRRMSDECLPEMQILDALVRRLGRARYRKDVGVCAKVEPATATPAAK